MLAAKRLGYFPSRFGRSLRVAKTGTLGLLAPDLENPIAHEHLSATIRAAHKFGYTVFVADGQESRQIQDLELQRLREFRVDGLIIGRGILHVTQGFVDFIASGVPVEPDLGTAAELESLIDTSITPYPERAALDSGAAAIAYRRLYDLGHRRFAVFRRGIDATELALQRVATLRKMLDDLGLHDATIKDIGVDELADCVGEVQNLLASPNRPTAIVSANGRQTPFVLQGIHSSGLKIPEDVSFLCFGDSPWHTGYAPPLAVIRHDYSAAARRSVELIVSRVEAREMPITPLHPSEFVPRNSLGRCPESR